MALFLQPNRHRALGFHALAVIGALAVSVVCLTMSDVLPSRAAVWVGLILSAEIAAVAVNERLAGRAVPDTDLPHWSAIKTTVSGLQGLAWAAGSHILHVEGAPVTVLAPAWAIMTVTIGIIYACAPWPPALYLMATTATVPAALTLLYHGGLVEVSVAVCMLVGYGFAMLLGMMAIRNVGDLIHARLDIAALAARQTRLATRLESVNADRAQFFSAASHDLRQPLQALGFYSALLQDSPDDPAAVRDLVPRMAAAVDDLDRLFNAILGVAAADGAAQKAQVQTVALGPILDRLRDSYAPEAALKGLALRLRATPCLVSVPPEVLERVIGNLLSNAVRYTRQGGVLIAARSRGDRVEILVADTGIGMTAADLPRIFSDYVQVANPQRNALSGYGLGLAIVKRLVDGLGWTITVRSRPGRGSLFILSVPAGSATDVPPPASLQEPIPLPRIGVLVVDDDPLVCDATWRLVTGWGIPCLATTDHDRAKETCTRLLAEVSSVVALVDFRLDGATDGVVVANSLQQTFGPAVVPCLLTGETQDSVKQAASMSGLIMITKPIRPIRLRAILSATSPAGHIGE
jgi:signal transduction histidine kinase/CheY-like chemotaxis protein